MKNIPNHYEVLGVPRTATVDEIKKAYKALSLKYHPDKNKDPGASEKFQEVSKANQILSDSARKAEYDLELQFECLGGFPHGGVPSYVTTFHGANRGDTARSAVVDFRWSKTKPIRL